MVRLIPFTFVFVLATVAQSLGQDQRSPQNSAPPPLKIITTTERNVLAGINDNKSRVRKSIELAEGHLLKAETLTTQEKFSDASAELGTYQALLEDALHFLSTLKAGSDKTRDLYKRLELSLRAEAPRLTLMRRSTPLEYAVWIKETEEFTRASRTEALNSFYGQTVVRENPHKPADEKPRDKHPKEALAPLESKQP